MPNSGVKLLDKTEGKCNVETSSCKVEESPLRRSNWMNAPFGGNLIWPRKNHQRSLRNVLTLIYGKTKDDPLLLNLAPLVCWWNQKTGLKLNCINLSVLLPNGIQKGVPTAIIGDVVNVLQTNNLSINTMKYAWSDKKKFRLFKSLSAVLGSSVKTNLNFTT